MSNGGKSVCRIEKVSLEAWYARFHTNGGKPDGDFVQTIKNDVPICSILVNMRWVDTS